MIIQAFAFDRFVGTRVQAKTFTVYLLLIAAQVDTFIPNTICVQHVLVYDICSLIALLPILKSQPIGVKVPSTSSLSVYTKVLAHNLNDIRNWASLIGLLLRICWCLLSVFLIYCSDEWKKLVNLIYCFQVLFWMNFKIMYFLMKILGNTPSAVSAASRDSLSSQNATWGIVFVSSFYWWHIEYNGWMCERLLNLQEVYVSGQNICIEVYGNSVGTITPIQSYAR